MQKALRFQYVQHGTAFHGTFHDTASTHRITDGVYISICILECLFDLRQYRVVGAHSKTVESEVEFQILDLSIRKFYCECVFLNFLKC